MVTRYVSCFQLFRRFVENNRFSLYFDHGFAVATSVAVVYDWGEQDLLCKNIIDVIWYSPVLTFGQEVSRSIADRKPS
jgi:hypothetical protein